MEASNSQEARPRRRGDWEKSAPGTCRAAAASPRGETVNDVLRHQTEVLDGSADFAELDRFVSATPNASPFQTGFIAKAYSRCPDAEPVVLAVRGRKDQLMASMIGVVFSHGKRPGSVADRWSRHCTVRGTPLSLPNESSEIAVRQLQTTLEETLRPNSTYIRYYPDRDGPFLDVLREGGHVREDWVNFVVDLAGSEDQILQRMSKQRRKGVQTGLRSGLSITEVESRADLGDLYTILKQAHTRLKIPFQSRELFESIYADLVPKKRSIMLLAKHSEETLAGRIILVSNEIAYDWYAGSQPRARPLHADEILAWASMLTAKKLGAATFDFGGAGNPHIPYGPREFKRRFGGVETNLGRFTKILHPSKFRVVNAVAGVLRRVK